MTRDVEDALASHAEEYEVRRQLHDVPPHAVYEVTVDGRRAVCKLARGPEADPATEGRVVAFVGERTAVPVPEVLAVGDDWFLTRWCEAAPRSGTEQAGGGVHDVDAGIARTLGEGLATLHAETAFERPGFPVAGGGELRIDGRETWTEALAALLGRWGEFLDGVGYGGVAGEVQAFVRGRRGLFEAAGEPVLAHGWYTPEHVGIDDDEVTCVLDWEHALAAPGEYDYWRTETVVFGNGPSDAREAFRAGYESVRPLPGPADLRRRAYRVVALVYFLVSAHVQRQHPDAGIEERCDRIAEEIREMLAALR